jgi:hypothetical protein
MSSLCVLALGAAFAQPAVAQTGTDFSTSPQLGLIERLGAQEMYNTIPADFEVPKIRHDRLGNVIPDTFVSVPRWDFTQPFTDPLDGRQYQPQWVGAVPGARSSNLGFVLLNFRFVFASGGVTDANLPSCGETVSVANRFLKSPLLVATPFASNGVNVGSRQYIDAFQTAEFAGAGFPSTYHTNFVYKGAVNVTVSVPKADGVTLAVKGCKSPVGFVLQSYVDKLERGSIIPAVFAKYKLPHTYIPFSLFNNTFMSTGPNFTKQCCVIGYHSVYGSNSTFGQVYGVGSYEAPGFFYHSSDVSALSHELGELINDPFGNNPTPAWGHIGQVSACQDNYEVGDPLSGATPATGEVAKALNGFTYHLQDLAFFSWFYRGTASNGLYLGTGKKYSFNGTLTSATLQRLCV